MHTLARLAIGLLIVVILAIYLPTLFAMSFDTPLRKSHLLYSPVLEQFIWKEKVLNPPEEAEALAEDHHAEFVYQDEAGVYYTREDFEKNLPFIYYKNMELWGLLPITLAGQTFDAATIRANRRVLQLDPATLRGEPVPVLPLLESEPDSVRLVFPEDRYRLVPNGLEFINADFNAVDAALSEKFTTALTEAGFVFPARFAAGRHSILKPYDAGHFLVDATGALYHLKRVRGEPVVIRTPVNPALDLRHMEVMESSQRDYYGLLLGHDGRVHLLAEDGYAVHTLTTPGYDPETMEFKVLLNPLYVTAVYSDEATITGVAMDRQFTPLREYTHTMSRAHPRPAQVFGAVLFPFQLHLTSREGGGLAITWGGLLSVGGMLAAAAALVGLRHIRGLRPLEPVGLVLTCLTGIYGLAVVSLVLDE